MATVARNENISAEIVLKHVADGTVVFPANAKHQNFNVCGIGQGLRTKVNANFGTSSDYGSVETELAKLEVATAAGADTVMDLSTGGDINSIRRSVITASRVPVGTVPLYQAGFMALDRGQAIVDMSIDDLFNAVIDQAEDGVDFMTIHAGVTRQAPQLFENSGSNYRYCLSGRGYHGRLDVAP